MAYSDIDSGKVLNKEGLLELSGQIKGYINTNMPQSYTLPTASTSTLGGVKVDGETITIEDGVISAVGGSGDGGNGYTAGSGIEINENNVIKNKVNPYMFFSINALFNNDRDFYSNNVRMFIPWGIKVFKYNEKDQLKTALQAGEICYLDGSWQSPSTFKPATYFRTNEMGMSGRWSAYSFTHGYFSGLGNYLLLYPYTFYYLPEPTQPALYISNPNDTDNKGIRLKTAQVQINNQTISLENLLTNINTRIPTAPTTDGTYMLKCVVSSGTPTYSWVSV